MDLRDLAPGDAEQLFDTCAALVAKTSGKMTCRKNSGDGLLGARDGHRIRP